MRKRARKRQEEAGIATFETGGSQTWVPPVYISLFSFKSVMGENESLGVINRPDTSGHIVDKSLYSKQQ